MSVLRESLPYTTKTKESTVTQITFLTKPEIEELRAKLLAEAGLDLAELRTRQAAYMLSPEQSLILEELEDLEFLAGA